MSHKIIDERSLDLHSLIARKLETNPRMLDIARNNLERWLTDCSDAARPSLLEWREILSANGNTKQRVLRVLTGKDDRSRRLRQSSPFAGEQVLTRTERNAILARHKG